MRVVQLVAVLLVLSACPAFAQRAPVMVIPGRPDVPVLIDGVDVSWAVVEGEFGLDRPGAMSPRVVFRPFAVPIAYGPGPYYRGRDTKEPGYFPSTGQQPGYGRLEVVPPPDRPLPPKAPSFRQGWSSRSDPGPATDYAPFAAPPFGMGGGNYRSERRHGGNGQGSGGNGIGQRQGAAQGSGRGRR